jgi:hypothetical protein
MPDTLTVLEHHLASFRDRDLDSLMDDYTDQTVFFTVDGKLAGRAPIRRLMAGLCAEFGQPGATFEMRAQNIAGEVAHIVWSGETPTNRYELATDTFVVRDGKIVYQSFAGKVVPRV